MIHNFNKVALIRYVSDLVWVGMAMFAASPTRIMEAAPGRLPKCGAGAFSARPAVVDSTTLDVQVANMAIPPHSRLDTYLIKAAFLKFGKLYRDLVQV